MNNQQIQIITCKTLAETGSCQRNENSPTKEENQEKRLAATNESLIVKTTLFRFVILFLFCLNAANKAFQWIQISSITDKLTFYYDVGNYMINTTSIVFMCSFIILSIPACCIIEIIGIRKAVLIGSSGTAIGSIVKCFACDYESPNSIYLLFLGQTLVSLSEQFIFSIPSKLASIWFPDNQVSSAVAICILGQQLGVALGFILPQYFLEACETKEDIGAGLYRLFYYTMMVSVLAFIADFLLFFEEPKNPPGNARMRQILKKRADSNGEQNNLRLELARVLTQTNELMRNKYLNFLNISFAINAGIGYTVLVLLNQMLVPLWPNDETLVSRSGFLIIFSGVIGSLVWGQLMDRCHRYLLMNIFLTISTLVALFVFMYSICFLQSKLAVYLAASFYGVFQIGIVVAGLEFAVELTYPVPELISSSLLNISPQIFSIITIYWGSFIVDNYGTITTCVFYILWTVVALIPLLNIKEVLKRQEAVRESKAGRLSTNEVLPF